MRDDHPDKNAPELTRNLSNLGWRCVRIRGANRHDKGVPDSIVAWNGRPRSGKTHLLEIKRLGGKLSAEQIAFATSWPGCVHCATSSWEANLLLLDCEGRR